MQQKLIIAYAEESALDEYYNEGGEDWSLFTYDVDNYITDDYSDENITYFYDKPDWITADEMNAFAKEIGNESLNFGYYLIDGDKNGFVPHDMPEYIIEQACEFFGFDY